MRLLLKTMVSNPSEIPFLWMMFDEARDFVDQIIVTEFDETHSGLPREFIFDAVHDDFAREFPQLVYLQGSQLDGVVRNADTADEHHHNETLMRGWFARQLPFKKSDIIFSTDADEVLYRSTCEWVAENFSRRSHGVRFRLHQFFYRPNYLWLDKDFVAPVALKYGRYAETYPNNWRYQGSTLDGFWGAHFSWCIPIDEMVKKVKNYSHAAEYGHLERREFFEVARDERPYIFDESEDFRLATLGASSKLLPDSFSRYSALIDNDVLGGVEPKR